MPRSAFLLTTALLLFTSSYLLAWQADGKQRKRKAPRKTNPAMQPIKDKPGLPRVLLIGDSISIGYTLPVRKKLEGVANVHRPLTNCGPTTRGVQQIDQWLGNGKWDLIHFNWGLHDLKYMGPNGKNLADPKLETSFPQVALDAYEKNLRILVKRLKQTGAKLIWCATTPVPDGAKGRVVGDAVKYNAVAARVMEEEGVEVNDLYGFAKQQLAEIQLKANVHFSKPGSEVLANEVARRIRESL